jgi:Uma2 family endonuclease
LPVYRFTVDEYHRLTKAGILTENHDVELLEGLIVPKMPRNPPHEYSLSKTNRLIAALLSSDWYIRSQMAITTDDSEPEPDSVVVEAPEERYEARHPTAADIGLLVEVSDSTLGRDRGEKLVLYGRAGIVCYWIINIPDRQIEVYTIPTGPVDEPGFGQCQIYRPGDAVPVSLRGRVVGTIPVNDLLPRPQ